MDKKFNIAFLGSDNHAGAIADMFQDALPHHPLVEHVDFEWSSKRFGKDVLDTVSQKYILENITNYDLIFHNPWMMNEENTPGFIDLLNRNNLWSKVILYDSADQSQFCFEDFRSKCLLYCKRAWWPDLLPQDMGNVIPLDFPLFQGYLDVVPVDYSPYRDMHISCMLGKEGEDGSIRGRVIRLAKTTDFSMVKVHPQPFHVNICYTSGEVSSSAATSYRETLSPPAPQVNWWYIYMHLLRRTQILFTAANQTAVGDHRTWESFSSGALVMTDRIPVPNPNNPVEGKHYIKMDVDNPERTIALAKELLEDHTERKRIARAGLEHAIKYHHSDSRIAYVMDEVVKRLGGL